MCCPNLIHSGERETIPDLPEWKRASLNELFEWVYQPPANILYTTFDHPLIKMAGVDTVFEAWRERELKSEGQAFD